jgi:molybdate transport system substrate-binding protein
MRPFYRVSLLAQALASSSAALAADVVLRLTRLRSALLAVRLLASLPLGAAAFGAEGPAKSGTVSVAAAANLVYALEALNAEFARTAPDIKVTTTTGASGNLVAQIKHGAPFEVFLSADVDYPQALVKAGQADAKSFSVFATGRLVLWTTKPATEVALASIPATVRDPAVKKIAMANRDTAPYGRAARQALEKLGAWTEAQPKIVTGDNITQTAQFVETGSAEAGFVALSLVMSPRLKDRGRWLEVPVNLYASLDHAAVLTLRGAESPAAKRYLAFLATEPARKIFRDFGYNVP